MRRHPIAGTSSMRRGAALGVLGLVAAALTAGLTTVAAPPADAQTTTAPASAAPASTAPASTAPASTAPSSAAPSSVVLRSSPDVFIVIDNNVRLAERLGKAKQAVLAYLNALPADSQIGLVTFGESPQMIRDLGQRGPGLLNAVSAIAPEGDPSRTGQLFGAVVMAADSLQGSTSKRPTLLLVADGRDDGSSSSFSNATSSLARVNARVDVIDLGADAAGLAVLNQFAATRGAVMPSANLPGIEAAAVDVNGRGTAWGKPREPGMASRIFSSPVTLGIGGLSVFAGLVVGVLALLGPRGEKVDLLGVTGRNAAAAAAAANKKQSAISGLAVRLSDAADKQLAKSGRDRSMNARLEQAALNLRSGEFIILTACIGLAGAAAANLLIGRIGALVGLLFGIVGTVQWVSMRATKRSKRFGDQLPDTLQLLASSLRAGQGLVQAFDSVAREAESPTREEFHRMVVETRLGRDLVDAMRSAAVRVKSEDMSWVVPAVEINREVGGDLAEVLDQVGQTIRDRADLKRQVKTLSAEGRLSAVILLGLPFTLAGFIKMSNPEYMDPLFKGIGLYLVGMAGLAMVLGGFWLLKICKIEF
jgi:tight adherence protein B